LEVKWPGHEVDHVTLFSAKVKKSIAIVLLPIEAFMEWTWKTLPFNLMQCRPVKLKTVCGANPKSPLMS